MIGMPLRVLCGLDRARHAERRIAHEVDADLCRCGDLGADRQTEPRAELVRLAPAHVAARLFRDIERQQLARGLTEIVVTIASSDGMTRMNSDITKIGQIGLSVERSFASQRASHAAFSSAMRWRAPVEWVLPPSRSRTASISCPSISSRRRGSRAPWRFALCRSRVSLVAWMIVLPGGMIGVEMLCRVRLVPIAKITSLSSRNWRPCR